MFPNLLATNYGVLLECLNLILQRHLIAKTLFIVPKYEARNPKFETISPVLALPQVRANVHDSEMAITLVDGIPPIKQPQGRPRRRPDEVLADRAYDAEEKIRQPLRQRKTKPLIAKRNTQNGSGLGKFRYVVEAAFDWLFNQRRLRVRYEKRDDIHQAFLIIGCFLICWRRIMEFC